MKGPFCRPGLLWEYTITVSCHCLMPSPFMQSIQGGAPGEWPTSDEGKRLARGSTPDERGRLARGPR